MISAGIDNDLKIWDTRKNSVLTEMSGHTDTVTGMKLSPDGAHVLTNAMDNTVRMWVSWGKPVVSRTFIHDVSRMWGRSARGRGVSRCSLVTLIILKRTSSTAPGLQMASSSRPEVPTGDEIENLFRLLFLMFLFIGMYMSGKQQAEKLSTSCQVISAASMMSTSTVLNQSYWAQGQTSKSISGSSSLEIKIENWNVSSCYILFSCIVNKLVDYPMFYRLLSTWIFCVCVEQVEGSF